MADDCRPVELTDDDLAPIFELTPVASADCAILATIWSRACADAREPAPKDPFVGVIAFWPSHSCSRFAEQRSGVAS